MQYLKSKKDIKLIGKNYYFIPEAELLTLKEFYNLRKKYEKLSINDFELIEINKNKTAYFFGARIAI